MGNGPLNKLNELSKRVNEYVEIRKHLGISYSNSVEILATMEDFACFDPEKYDAERNTIPNMVEIDENSDDVTELHFLARISGSEDENKVQIVSFADLVNMIKTCQYYLVNDDYEDLDTFADMINTQHISFDIEWDKENLVLLLKVSNCIVAEFERMELIKDDVQIIMIERTRKCLKDLGIDIDNNFIYIEDEIKRFLNKNIQEIKNDISNYENCLC